MWAVDNFLSSNGEWRESKMLFPARSQRCYCWSYWVFSLSWDDSKRRNLGSNTDAINIYYALQDNPAQRTKQVSYCQQQMSDVPLIFLYFRTLPISNNWCRQLMISVARRKFELQRAILIVIWLIDVGSTSRLLVKSAASNRLDWLEREFQFDVLNRSLTVQLVN